MELVAFGFNAHGQITKPKGDICPGKVVVTAKNIKLWFSSWSETAVEIDGEIQLRGTGSPTAFRSANISAIRQVFGDFTGPKGFLTTCGNVWWFQCDEDEGGRVCDGYELRPIQEDGDLRQIAVAGNGQASFVHGSSKINLMRSVTDLAVEHSWELQTAGIIQIEANETSFVALTIEGQVYTWGDHRFRLGRDATEDEPAERPCLVGALDGLNIVKISAGGWLAAAVSEDRDLYIWGNSQPACDDCIEFLPKGEEEDVGLVDLGDEVDVIDVAVGAGHICVLTADGDVYTAGRNENGQTGIENGGKFQRGWKKVEKSWDGRVEKVFVGSSSWNTFMITRDVA